MAKCYVVSGAKINCTMGTVKAPLKVLPTRRVKVKGKLKANMLDNLPYVNVGPFGVCKITKLPCTPACTPWLNSKTNVLVQGVPALMEHAVSVCMAGGGVLKFEDNGQ